MHRPAHVVAERNGSARPRARRAGRPRGGAPDRAVPPDPLALCHRLLQSQVPRVVRLQGPPAVSFPVEHDGLLARRRSRRLKLADPALHARPDRAKLLSRMVSIARILFFRLRPPPRVRITCAAVAGRPHGRDSNRPSSSRSCCNWCRNVVNGSRSSSVLKVLAHYSTFLRSNAWRRSA